MNQAIDGSKRVVPEEAWACGGGISFLVRRGARWVWPAREARGCNPRATDGVGCGASPALPRLGTDYSCHRG